MRPPALLRRTLASFAALVALRWPASLLLAQEGHVATASTTDPVSQGIVAVINIAVFVLLSLEAAHRVLVAMSAVALLFLISYFSPYHLIPFDGVAAALDNVTTVIIVTPMVIGMAKRVRINAVVLILPMVMAANIGGTATLIGDPPNLVIGSGANLSFIDFMVDLTLPCAVVLFWLEWYTRRYYHSELNVPYIGSAGDEPVPALADPRLARWLGGICVMILVGFLTHHATGRPPAVPALVGAAAALAVQDLLYLRTQRPTSHERIHGILHVTEREIEWPTLSFFGFHFIVVGAAVATGLIATLADDLQSAINASSSALGLSPNGTLLLAAVLICWVSGLLSAFIDNIRFVAVAIPIVARLIPTMQGANADVLWWALSLGACLEDNGTVIGASANVTTIGLSE